MLLSDAAADDYGERWRLLLLLDLPAYGKKKNQRTQDSRRKSIQIITHICSYISRKPREASPPAHAPWGGLICFPWDEGGTAQIKADLLEFTTSSDIQAPWANITWKMLFLQNDRSIFFLKWMCKMESLLLNIGFCSDLKIIDLHHVNRSRPNNGPK